MALKKPNWTALEIFAIYVQAIAFVAWKTWTLISPTSYTPRAQSAQMVLLGSLILLTLTYLIKQLEKLGLNPHVPRTFKSFSTGFTEWLAGVGEVDDVVICAYTSHTFREALWSRRTKMAKVRVLLFYPTDDYATIEGMPDQSVGSIQNTIDLWKTMATGESPLIGTLEIRQRRYNASIFFGIINKSQTIHGLLFPRKKMGGLEPRDVFVLGQESASMREQTSLYREWFEEMWAVADPR